MACVLFVQPTTLAFLQRRVFQTRTKSEMSDPLLPPLPRAYVTLLTDEGFLNGALCLLRSLACTSVPTSVPTVAVMVTPAVGRLARARLQRVGAVVIEVQPIPLALGPVGPTSAAAATGTAACIHAGVSVAGAGSEAVEPRVAPPSASAASVGSADRDPSPASAATPVTSHVPSWTTAGTCTDSTYPRYCTHRGCLCL